MKPTSETRQRFLMAIAAKVTREAIVEAHMFQPIRQGGMESGVAVVAVHESVGAGNDPDTQPAPAEDRRLAVYSAQYRLTLKGPERGKWEFFINAEADAPLVTVDAVVRGVQRRSGDAEDPAKLSGDEVREALPPPPVPPAEPALPSSEAAGTMG